MVEAQSTAVDDEQSISNQETELVEKKSNYVVNLDSDKNVSFLDLEDATKGINLEDFQNQLESGKLVLKVNDEVVLVLVKDSATKKGYLNLQIKNEDQDVAHLVFRVNKSSGGDLRGGRSEPAKVTLHLDTKGYESEGLKSQYEGKGVFKALHAIVALYGRSLGAENMTGTSIQRDNLPSILSRLKCPVSTQDGFYVPRFKKESHDRLSITTDFQNIVPAEKFDQLLKLVIEKFKKYSSGAEQLENDIKEINRLVSEIEMPIEEAMVTESTVSDVVTSDQDDTKLLERERVEVKKSEIGLGSKEQEQVTDEAVADAMTVGLYHLSMPFLREIYEQKGTIPVDRVVQKDSKDNCLLNSKESMAFLAERHPQEFQKLFLLQSKKNTPPFAENWSLHVYFVAQSNDGSWYAGSPANYEANKPDKIQESVNVLKAGSLQELLDEISRVSGGSWGTEAEILEAIDYHNPEMDVADKDGNFRDWLEKYTEVKVDYTGIKSEFRENSNSV